MLNHCGLDASNPAVREWSIAAIRNLCELNDENVAQIKQLGLIGIANEDELRDMGLAASVSQEGKPSIRKINPE